MKENSVWCEHIRWFCPQDESDGWWQFERWENADEWNFCPTCSAPNPRSRKQVKGWNVERWVRITVEGKGSSKQKEVIIHLGKYKWVVGWAKSATNESMPGFFDAMYGDGDCFTGNCSEEDA